MIQFHQGQGDVTLLKASGRTLNVTIGPGLPSSTSELYMYMYMYVHIVSLYTYSILYQSARLYTHIVVCTHMH